MDTPHTSPLSQPAEHNGQLPPDRSHLATEARDPTMADLDTLETQALLARMNHLDAQVASDVAAAIPAITHVVDAVARAMAKTPPGRLIYLGAGTSGRLGVLDASECPPTFSTEPDQVTAIIAGGDGALRKSSEGKEDDWQGAIPQLDDLELSANDVVVGIAAGGSTPYVLGGLKHAKSIGCVTAILCCVKLTDRHIADHLIEVPVGPELVTGSSRLKAGTATKLVLNMITTATMVKIGKTWGNLMVDVRATNAKLRDRAARIISQQTGLSREASFAALEKAQGHTKYALIMVLKKVSLDEAMALLGQHAGHLRSILGAPR